MTSLVKRLADIDEEISKTRKILADLFQKRKKVAEECPHPDVAVEKEILYDKDDYGRPYYGDPRTYCTCHICGKNWIKEGRH